MDVAERLKNYAKTHVETINKEYYSQTLKWKSFLNKVGDCQAKAIESVQASLKEIKEKQAEADRLMLMAFSLVGIAGSAWIGAIIEIKLYPRLFGKMHYKEFMTFKGMRVKTEMEYSEIAAKFYGDTAHEVTGHAFDAILEHMWPKEGDPLKMDRALSSAIEAGELGSFKSRVEDALLDASRNITAQLGILSERINQLHRPDGGGFGESVKEIVEKKFPRPRGMKDDAYDKMVEWNGQRMLTEYFDTLRQKYAKNWFYYGNNPLEGQLPFLPFQLEIETWALWILSQEWKKKTTYSNDAEVPGVDYLVTEDGFELDNVMKALEELGGKELRGNVQLQPKKSPLKRQGWIQEIDSQADDDRDRAGGLLTAADRSFDEDTDMAKLLNWAKSQPGRRLKGQLDSRPRNIGTLANIETVFAD